MSHPEFVDNLDGNTLDRALRERLERERHQRSAEERLRRIRAIAERFAAQFPDSGPPIDHAELLYDEWGLPK